MQKIYYIPIKKENLAHYFETAIIMPKRFYDKNKILEDIQNNAGDYIFIQKEKKYIEEHHLLLEVILETQNIVDENFYNKPIAITRITKIYHNLEKETLDQLIWLISKSNHIDKEMFVYEKFEIIKSDFDKAEYKNEHLEEQIKRFNALLGAISFSKYSLENLNLEQWFKAIFVYNKHIQENFNSLEIIPALKSFGEGLESGVKKYKVLTEQEIEAKAKEKHIELEISMQQITLKNIQNRELFLYALLYNSERLENPNSLFGKYKESLKNVGEFSAYFTYGYFKGYKRFHKDDKYSKLNLKLLLDRYVIESIYLTVFYDKKNIGQLKYIENDIGDCISYEYQSDYKSFIFLNETIKLKDKPIFPREAEEFIKPIKEKLDSGFLVFIGSIKQYVSNLSEKFKKKELEFQDDLKSEKDKYFKELKDKNDDISKLKEDDEKQKNEILNLQNEKHEATEKLKTKEIEFQDNLKDKENKYQEVIKEINNIKSELSSKKDAINELEKLKQEQETNILTLEEKNNKLQNDLKTEKDKYFKELKDKNDDISKLKEDDEKQKNEILNLQNEKHEATEKLKTKEIEIKKLKSEKTKLNTQIKNLKENRQKTNSKISSTQKTKKATARKKTEIHKSGGLFEQE